MNYALMCHVQYLICYEVLLIGVCIRSQDYKESRLISYGSTSTKRKGVCRPLAPCRPSLRPLQGPGVCLPKIVTLRRGDAAARAVIGPLTRRRTKTASFTTASKRLRGHCVASSWNHN